MKLYLIFAGIDYLLGTTTALVKGGTSKGKVSSKIMTNGIIKKLCCSVLILVAYLIQREMNVEGLYSLVSTGFVISEGLSILETCHKNGVTCAPLEHFFEERNDTFEEDK